MAQAGDDQKRYPMLMLMDLHRPKYYTLPSGTEYLQYTHRSQVPAVHFHSIYPAIPSHPIPSHSIHPTASLDIKPDKPLNHRIIDPTFLIKGIPCNTIFISPVVKHMQSSNRARFPGQGILMQFHTRRTPIHEYTIKTNGPHHLYHSTRCKVMQDRCGPPFLLNYRSRPCCAGRCDGLVQ